MLNNNISRVIKLSSYYFYKNSIKITSNSINTNSISYNKSINNKLFFTYKYMYKCYIYMYFNMYYKSKLLIYSNILEKSLKNNLYVNNLITCNYNISVRLLSFYNNTNAITSNFLTSYFYMKLKQNIKLNSIIKSALRIINSIPQIYSYRIINTGKFTKKQRSTYVITNSTNKIEIPNGSVTEYIDYAEKKIITRYGICNTKIWLFFRLNYNIEFEFKKLHLHNIESVNISNINNGLVSTYLY